MTNTFLSENIIRLRKEQNLSQEKLAELARISYHTVFRAEAGADTRRESVEKIAKALGVDAESLFKDPNSQNENKNEPAINSQVKEALTEALKQSLSKEQLELLALIQGLSASEAESIIQIIRTRLARPPTSSDNDKLASNK